MIKRKQNISVANVWNLEGSFDNGVGFHFISSWLSYCVHFSHLFTKVSCLSLRMKASCFLNNIQSLLY